MRNGRMTIGELVERVTRLQKLYPYATVYFTDEVCGNTLETQLEDFYIDEESNEIEVKFSA